MQYYTHKQPALPAPSQPKRKKSWLGGGFFKKFIILLVVAFIGNAYHSFSSGKSIFPNLTSKGSLYAAFKRLRPNKDPEKLDDKSVPLIRAAAFGDTSEVKKLLVSGAKIDGRDGKFRTPLMFAAYKGENEICEILLAAGASLITQDMQQHNALDYAAAKGRVDTVKILLEKSGKNDGDNNLQYAKLIIAAFAGDTSLFPKGNELKTINRLSVEGRSPLHIAASQNSSDMVQALIKKGADIDLRNASRQTPLHFAAWSNQVKVAKALVDEGADIDAKDSSGNTPLMFAAARGSKEMISFLIREGANKKLRNNAGKTAAEIANKGWMDKLSGLF